MSFFARNLGGPSAGGGGGGARSEVILLEVAGTYPLVGESGIIQLPAPDSGKKYHRIDFDILGHMGPSTGPDSTTDHRPASSDGVYFDIGGSKSSWYRALAWNGAWYAGINDDDTNTTYTVGVIYDSGTRLWSIEYNPTSHQISLDRGNAAPQDDDSHPNISSALIVAQLSPV